MIVVGRSGSKKREHKTGKVEMDGWMGGKRGAYAIRSLLLLSWKKEE